MLLLNEIMLGACVMGWLRLLKTLSIARTRDDAAAVSMLRWIALGFGCSAFSNLFRIIDYGNPGHASIPGLAFGVVGVFALFIGWFQYVGRAAAGNRTVSCDDGGRVVSSSSGDTGRTSNCRLPLGHEAVEAMAYAYAEAARQSVVELDTEHVLLGILEMPRASGTRVLKQMGVRQSDICAALVPSRRNDSAALLPWLGRCPEVPLPECPQNPAPACLSVKAKEAIELASKEAARFDASVIGTEHLLLGLALAGTGSAAQTLYRHGISVDLLREEILRRRGPVRALI